MGVLKGRPEASHVVADFPTVVDESARISSPDALLYQNAPVFP
jgi:hypothetical protein